MPCLLFSRPRRGPSQPTQRDNPPETDYSPPPFPPSPLPPFSSPPFRGRGDRAWVILAFHASAASSVFLYLPAAISFDSSPITFVCTARSPSRCSKSSGRTPLANSDTGTRQ